MFYNFAQHWYVDFEINVSSANDNCVLICSNFNKSWKKNRDSKIKPFYKTGDGLI